MEYLHYYSHTYGSCNIVNGKGVVWVPKCASTFVRTLSPRQHNFMDNDAVKEFGVFLRSPYLRWKVGLAEYAFRANKTIREMQDTLMQIEFDEHTVPQVKFLPPEEKGRTTFFNLDNKGIENFLRMWVPGSKHLAHEIIYGSKENISKMRILLELERCLDRRKIKQICDYYADDYSLMYKNFTRNEVL